MHDIYDKTFYAWQREGAYLSATQIVPALLALNPANSVLDVGCGVGAWLRAFQEHGVQRLVGLDGAWVTDREQYVPEGIIRIQDLAKPFQFGQRFDLVTCFEVAEHLPDDAASQLISSLVTHSDVVAFSAAAPFQGGNGHINERWPEFWAELFRKHGYSCYDELRQKFWLNEDVEWWYSQNMFLAVKDGHPLQHDLGKPTPVLPLAHPRRYELLGRRLGQLQQFLGLSDWDNLPISPWPVIAATSKLMSTGATRCLIAGATDSGKLAARILQYCGITVLGITDRDKNLHAQHVEGIPIRSLASGLAETPEAVLICAQSAASEIEREIKFYAINHGMPQPSISLLPRTDHS